MAEGGYLRANVVSTLDGSATGEDGLTGSINDAADHRVFALLRALSDVIVVGAGTARAEGYRRARTPDGWRAMRAAEGLSEHPTIAVVSRSLNLPEPLLDVDPEGGALVVLTSQDAEPSRIAALTELLGDGAVVPAGRGSVDVESALRHLAGQGLRRMLTEGGPQLLNDTIRAGLLDDLCLTMSPLLVGGSGPRLGTGAPVHQRMHLRHALQSDGSLLTRWVRR